MQQREARFLRLDTAFKQDKINNLNLIILRQTDISDKQESLVKSKNDEIYEYKVAQTDLIKKFDKQGKKLRNFKSAALVFGSTTLILIGLLLVLL
jgi:hypothetical protein